MFNTRPASAFLAVGLSLATYTVGAEPSTGPQVMKSNARLLLKEPAVRVQLFPLSAVRLLNGPLLEAADANRKYLLALDPDRLLAPFRREAGLTPKKPPYPNWESMGLDGHTAGHYLAALADMIAAGHDADGEFRRRLDAMIDDLADCQAANGNGFIGGTPGSMKLWQDVAAGRLNVSGFGINNKWVPWYNLHKTFAGLRDVYRAVGSEKAKAVLVRFADWADELASHLSDQQMQSMLKAEHGGMVEVLADVAAITGDDKYIRLSRRFYDHAVLDPLVDQKDQLTGKHANTQIPKVIGMERLSALTGDDKADTGADFFWSNVTRLRSVAFGGNSVSEHFNNPNDFSGMLQHREGPETCNTYNMLRLTEQLFERHPRANYADYYERALFNHLLSAINPQHPGYVYFTPIRPGHYRVYSQPETSFWCCVGTGMENPGRYGQFIYAHDASNLYVNLFVASELDASALGLKLRQETAFPDQGKTSLLLSLKQPKTFTLNVRHPSWVTDNDFKVSVNGQPVETNSESSSYASIRREWKDGDRVDVELPMRTTVEQLPDGSPWFAFLRGPIVLASPDGTKDLQGLYAKAGRGDHVAAGPTMPMDQAPVLVSTKDELMQNVVPDDDGKPLHFRVKNVADPASPDGLPLVPFFRLHDSRYQMYFNVSTREQLAAQREKLAAEERERQAREANTLDKVAVGEQQPEVEHNFSGDGVDTGIFNNRRWRHGRQFQYTLNPRGEKSVALSVTYAGGDRGRTFDVLVNDRLLKTERLVGEAPGRFIDRLYPIPADVLAGAPDGMLTVKFVVKSGLAGGIFDLRLVRSAAK